MTEDRDSGERDIYRRTVLKSAAAASVAGFVGVPAVSGTALAESDVSLDCELDILCAVDASGSLDADDVDLIEDGVNEFIDELETQAGDSVRVGSLQFAGGEITNLNGLQHAEDLSVTVDSPGGDTPMPAALDIADQILYKDSGQRDDADKLIVLFTDGGPNYETQYNDDLVYEATIDGTEYTAPRDSTTDWSAATDSGYDNPDGGTANVSEGEMDETARVTEAIKDESKGDGGTAVAAIYVDIANDVTNAMTQAAIDEYTDLPTYLEENISSSSELFLQGDNATEIAGLGTDLAEILEENCCTECEEDGALVKYEFGCVEEECVEWESEDEEECAERECVNHDFTPEGDEDGGISYSVNAEDPNYESKEGEENEPISVTFNTDYCSLFALVKSGQELEVQSFEEVDGGITVETANDGKYAISFVEFYCDEEAARAAKEEWGDRGGKGKGKRGGK